MCACMFSTGRTAQITIFDIPFAAERERERERDRERETERERERERERVPLR